MTMLTISSIRHAAYVEQLAGKPLYHATITTSTHSRDESTFDIVFDSRADALRFVDALTIAIGIDGFNIDADDFD